MSGSTVEVRDLRRDEIGAAVALLARGMRDNPLHVAAYGADPERRRRSLEQTFNTMFRVFGTQQPICALDRGTLVAVAGIAPTGTCQPTPRQLQRLRSLRNILAIGPSQAVRVGKWLAAWGERDPDQAHSHLGPFAVDAHLQGCGLGSKIMIEYCVRLDAHGEAGYLETDRQENVHFYERHGYSVIGQADVIGVPNWFMMRQPQHPYSR